jgi:hypothetical protein
MSSFFQRHLSYANVVATMALVFAMGGSALAAKHYLITSTKQIKPSVLKSLKGKTGTTGATGPQGAAGAAGTTGGQGKEGPPGLSALSTLPAGDSESGDYGIQAPTSKTSGDLEQAVTFPIPLAAPIPTGNVVYTEVGKPVTHCSGVGHAEAGYLCLYNAGAKNVDTPEVYNEEAVNEKGTGRFGFGLVWTVTGEEAQDYGTFTVTAP